MAEGMLVACAVEAGDWPDEAELEASARRAFAAAAERTDAPPLFEVSLLFTDDAHIQVLNRDFRGKDKPTNVLSFPAASGVFPDDATKVLGDIVIARETVEREAEEEGKSFDHHLTHLLVHGFLHLLGYDHESDDEAEEMEAMERLILAGLEISDPYA